LVEHQEQHLACKSRVMSCWPSYLSKGNEVLWILMIQEMTGWQWYQLDATVIPSSLVSSKSMVVYLSGSEKEAFKWIFVVPVS